MIIVYVFSLIFSGMGLWWSRSLTRSYPELCSRAVNALRVAVIVVIGMPLLWIAFSYVFKFL
jgi:hypothetical protein